MRTIAAFCCLFVGFWTDGWGDGLPRVWMSTTPRRPFESTIKLCAEQGVDAVELHARDDRRCAEELFLIRKYGVKGFLLRGDSSQGTKGLDESFEAAVFTGGAYRGKAIDRTLFSFTPGPHEILIEPPVYSRGQPYTVRREKGPDGKTHTIKGGHYFGFTPVVPSSTFVPTGKAEIIVPEKPFDGRPHIRIVPCEVLAAPSGSVPENDSARGMTGPEIENRHLVRLKFDLSDCSGMMLDKVGIAVYWSNDTNGAGWRKGKGQLSAFSRFTRERARRTGVDCAKLWAKANGGDFPSRDIVAIRFGDESFYYTGWLDCAAASFPLWGFSPSGCAAFKAAAPGLVQPRTWGFPEVYGAEAYGQALYALHTASASLVRAFAEGVRSVAPSVKIFRNTTRADVWAESNDHDGTGQELLARELDFLHLDPYPVGKSYNVEAIPFDMGYVSGLARRLGKPIIPWMQAHAYVPSGLAQITPDDMKRMWKQHKPFSPDGMMWLGFDLNPGNSDCEMTFPKGAPESWEYAKEMFAEVHAAPPVERRTAVLAVLRPYDVRALCCAQGAFASDGWRNPADRMLAAFVKAWSVDNGLLYDVFELPPGMDDVARAALARELKRYRHVVSSSPWPGARVIGAGTEGSVMNPTALAVLRRQFASEIAGMKHKGLCNE